MDIETDYLVVGAGASGLSFADSLLDHSDADMVLVDKRERAGGHWQDAYSFLRLHGPSAYYGVNSMALGQDRLIESGRNAGFYEQATSSEVREYYERVVADRLAPSGRVRFLGGHEYLGVDGDEHRLRDVRTGDVRPVRVRRRLVDATYLEGSIPATHQPSFTVAPEAAFVPVNGLPEAVDAHRQFTVIGAGKTSADACLWLIDHGVAPDQIRWVRPREAWFLDRAGLQPLDQVAALLEAISFDVEAAAHATDLEELFERLEDKGRMMRLDPRKSPTMFRGTMLSRPELAELREIADVVSLGRVRGIERDRIVLDEGELPTSPDILHVDCSAVGIRQAPAVPTFGPGRITIQQLRQASPTFNAALVAFIEATRDDDEQKNRVSVPHPYTSGVADWPAAMCRAWTNEQQWFSESDVRGWIAPSRLNVLRAFPEHAHEPRAQEALTRYLTNVEPAIERLAKNSWS